ncbi:homoserine dehydrogenase [Neobacillus dielmonensis]|uniref:homoserine dehydrogenase n=1 Tax=Neobacillus dielmonensis TaxID=1347369 RepID=UPI0005A62DC3|nr:homoserine dehydrogenase [Neobacillus dielmonensis]
MTGIKVAILGFGTVGEGVYRTIQSHEDELAEVLGKKVEVAAVLVRNKAKTREINDKVLVTTDFEDIICLPNLDVVIEAIVGQEPSYTYLKRAIQRGCHIITANKEMFAHYGKELIELAEDYHVQVGFEATVAGGIPVIQTLRQLLKINRVSQIHGILNGTSNFILTEMREKKLSFDQSLYLAQEKGYAEANPVNDVEGFDAFYKAMILSRIAFGTEPNWQDVEREGITNITSDLLWAADQLGLRFKHVASLTKKGEKILASVKPALVGHEHPFYHVEGVENAVNVHSDIVGRITLQGPGAGMFPTASAVIEDLVYVNQFQATDSTANRKLASHKVEEQDEVSEYWFIHGVSQPLSKLSVVWSGGEQAGNYVVKATKSDLQRLSCLEPMLHYYAILGDVEGEAVLQEQTVVI